MFFRATTIGGALAMLSAMFVSGAARTQDMLASAKRRIALRKGALESRRVNGIAGLIQSFVATPVLALAKRLRNSISTLQTAAGYEKWHTMNT
ncbi:hypothetical protein ACRQ5Q_09180 [Bradyrhizobium sp. PMVTL-01]|uniref:hypothetical protein n=1 Tax=Bradyrhizobium sp. PMVTL-01 TaxID=3434999 RepID=UPI003F6F06C2